MAKVVRCAICRGTERLERHHIKPVRRTARKMGLVKEPADDSPSNIIILCRRCHNYVWLFRFEGNRPVAIEIPDPRCCSVSMSLWNHLVNTNYYPIKHFAKVTGLPITLRYAHPHKHKFARYSRHARPGPAAREGR